MASASQALTDHLVKLGVDSRFHTAIEAVCMGRLEYVRDITPEDLLGRADSAGMPIEAPVARGIVRQLGSSSASRADGSEERSAVQASSAVVPRGFLSNDGPPWAVAAMSLQCGMDEEAPLVRCALRCKPSGLRAQRWRVFTAVLDRSGSMTNAWPLVAEAVACVISDELLADPRVSVNVITFDSGAMEAKLPASAKDLKEVLLSTDCRPRGAITDFTAAFAFAGTVISREVTAYLATGAAPADVDVTTLIFTDGCDTSVSPKGKPSAAADVRAREAGGAFQAKLRETGCPTYTCIAAFTEEHNPEQCQCLADRYSYIHRSEVLSEWLARDIGKIFQSTGHCSLRLVLPKGATLEEPIPAALPLDAEGGLSHHVWLRLSEVDGAAELRAELETAGGGPAGASAVLSAACPADTGSFEAHLYSLDLASLRLRAMARGLRGRRPAAQELEQLRARLLQSRAGVEPARDASADFVRGSTALRAVVADFDQLSERLSYALGHFEDSQDVRQIGGVAIDAILRDAGQHMPRAQRTAALISCVEAGAALPSPEALSPHGYGFALDAASGLDAEALARHGDALFFQLSVNADGDVPSMVDSDELAAYEAFMQRSSDCTQAVKAASGDGPELTHLGLPLYVSPGHFERARLHLPDVLGHLSPDNRYAVGSSERLLLRVLGRAMAAERGAAVASLEVLAQKARSLHAILSSTTAKGGSLLDEAVADAERFMDEPGFRKEAEDLTAVTAAGLLAEGWTEARYAQLGKAIFNEALCRITNHALRKTSEMECYWLVWALHGPADAESAWLDEPMEGAGDALHLRGAGFDPVVASDEMIAGSCSPTAPRSAGAEAVRSMLLRDVPSGVPGVSEWQVLRAVLVSWGGLVEQAGGLRSLWATIDARMVKDGAVDEAVCRKLLAPLRLPPKPVCLRDLFDDPTAALLTIASTCVGGWREGRDLMQWWSEGSGGQDQELPACRRAALGLRAVRAERADFARANPIRGAACPSTRDWALWGHCAEPMDRALYEEVRQMVHRRFNSMPYPIKQGLTDKNYRRKGGKFEFSSPLDSFIDGLHLRTRSLHQAWLKIGRKTGTPEVRAAAVSEMLLRLRWDDRDDLARVKLTRIVACIWDGLEGRPTVAEPPSSALWLDDGHLVDIPEAAAKVEGRSGPRCSANEALEALDDELQQQLEALPADLWAKMEAFADKRPHGGRLRLPAGLSPLDRKVVHMWAGARGLLSKSFGVGRRRRLRLAVPDAAGEATAPGEAMGKAGEDLLLAAEGEDEEEGEEEWQEVLLPECVDEDNTGKAGM